MKKLINKNKDSQLGQAEEFCTGDGRLCSVLIATHWYVCVQSTPTTREVEAVQVYAFTMVNCWTCRELLLQTMLLILGYPSARQVSWI